MKNDIQFNGEDLQLMAEFDECINKKYGNKRIVLKHIHTLDGVYIQHYLVIQKLEDFLYLEKLNHGDRVEFTGNVFSQYNGRVLLPRGFLIVE